MSLAVIRYTGFLDFSLRFGCDVSWCSGRNVFGKYFDHSLHPVFFRQICGGKMLQRIWNHSVGVDLTVQK